MVNVETVLDAYRRDAEKETAIDTAFKEICNRFGIDTEEALYD